VLAIWCRWTMVSEDREHRVLRPNPSGQIYTASADLLSRGHHEAGHVWRQSSGDSGQCAELLAGLEPQETAKRPIWASDLVAQNNVNYLLSPTRVAEGTSRFRGLASIRHFAGSSRGS